MNDFNLILTIAKPFLKGKVLKKEGNLVGLIDRDKNKMFVLLEFNKLKDGEIEVLELIKLFLEKDKK